MGVNLITPSSTLNEQFFEIPANTYDDNNDLRDAVNSALTTLLGWVPADGKPQASLNAGISVYAQVSGSSVVVKAENANGQVLDNTSAGVKLTCSQATRFYWHVSSDGKTMYLFITGSSNSTGGFGFVLAENDGGSVSVFGGNNGGRGFNQNSTAVINAAPFGSGVASSQVVSNELYYAVTKFPDFYDGGEFPSLYRLISTKVILPRNQLVQFGDTVFRLVYNEFASSGTALWFAFPVAG